MASIKSKNPILFCRSQDQTGHEVAENFKRHFRAEGHPYIKCYIPTAPERYLTIRDMMQRYWFDCMRIGKAEDDVSCSLKDSNDVSEMLDKMVGEIEESGIPRHRILIGGSSQGGMVSIYAAYVRGIEVGGVFGIAAAFPYHKQCQLLNDSKTHLLSIYGLKDAFIGASTMDRAWQLFRSKKIPMTVKSVRHLGHDMDPEYTKLLFDWLERKCPPINLN